MDFLHRIISANPMVEGMSKHRRPELVWASVFIMVWFVMDAMEWVDWAYMKLKPPPLAQCTTINIDPGTLNRGRALIIPKDWGI